MIATKKCQMRPIFTVHAGEFLVGQHIESSFKNKRVWVPTKDIGIDLLVTNQDNSKSVSLQVKFSRDFLPIKKLPLETQARLRSCTWFSFDRKRLSESPARYWVLVLLSFEKKSYDYLLITPQELLRRLEAIHGVSPRYQVYVWVTKRDRAWLARGLKKADEAQIANGTFRDELRDVTRYLEEHWSLIRDL
jgi:hypothetical protein